MSGDVQPRKRKDKSKKRKDDDEPILIREKRSSSEHSPDMEMHIEKESETGGHWCAKIVFFALLSILIGLIALIIIENRGMTEVAQPQGESRFSEYFEGWVEEPKDHDEDHVVHSLHDDHDDGEDDDDHGHDDDNNEVYEEENLSQQDDEDEKVPVSQEEGDDDDDAVDDEPQVSQEQNDEVRQSQEQDETPENDDDDDEVDQNVTKEQDATPASAENDNDDDGDQNVSAPEDVNLNDGDLPFEEETAPDSTEQFFDNDVGEELFVKRLSEEKIAKSKETTKSAENDETPEKSSVAVKIVVGITMLIVGVQVLVNRKPTPPRSASSSELYESREKITDITEKNNEQIQAFKTETIERYIAEQIPVTMQKINTDKIQDEMQPEMNEEEIEEAIIEPQQTSIKSRFHDFQAPPPKPVPQITETEPISDENENLIESKPIESEIESKTESKPVMDSLDPLERDPALLSDSSDVPYETLEVEFIDDDADWEDEEFDDEHDEIYSGGESPEDADDIDEPGSHNEDEEEEEVKRSITLIPYLMMILMKPTITLKKILNPKKALKLFEKLLKYRPDSQKLLLGKANALNQLSNLYQDNGLLREAIQIYEKLLLDKKIMIKDDAEYEKVGVVCVDRMTFLGNFYKAIELQKVLVDRFPQNPEHRNQLAIIYLMINRLSEAKHILHETLLKWRHNAVALVHYGFVLKQLDNNLEHAVIFLREGIESGEPGTQEGLFYMNLGDALMRLGRSSEALSIYTEGANRGLFLSAYQRSLYNIDRLKAQSFWELEETSYSNDLKKLQKHWRQILKEGVSALNQINGFSDESENLRDHGEWKQFELYARGRRNVSNCKSTPMTCDLIEKFPAASTCKRGQVKYSIMQPKTHVWAHTGPTNCRLRAHLGLKVPQGTFLRVGNETKSWKEGEWLIFDDSFEHEVWHNGTESRLVLIVDIWHPEITEEERKTLTAI
uniref:CSON011023 protein n=1 Tax=Culicoides sonorensis TaxID=179676 RepID=A0A336M2W2_CULSO